MSASFSVTGVLLTRANPDEMQSTSFLNGFSIRDQLTNYDVPKRIKHTCLDVPTQFVFNHGINIDAFDLTRIGLSHHELFMTLRIYV